MAVANSIRALDSGGQQNFGEEIAVLGRLEWDILDPYGYLETSPKPANSPQLSVGVAVAFNPIDGASTFQNVLPDDRTTNVTVDAGFRWKGLSLQAAAERSIGIGTGTYEGHAAGAFGTAGAFA